MKTSKLFTIDVELADQLKAEDNASQLVNDLLKAHYSSTRENLERRKAAVTKEIDFINAEEKEVNVIEVENERENAIRERIEVEKIKKIKEYEHAKKPWKMKVKNKEITFEDYLEATNKLKRKYGLK